MKKLAVLFICGMSLLSGCAVMSVEECQQADWTRIGERDGRAGLYSRIGDYTKACAKADIQPNKIAYQWGYIEGREQFCTPATVFYQRLEGHGNYEICPAELRAQLYPYHAVADAYYQARRDYDALLDDLERYQRNLLDQNLSLQRREEYRKKVRELRIQQTRIEFNYQEAARQLARFRRDKGL